jgi:hypothetical protein
MFGIEELRNRLSDLGYENDENEDEALEGALKRAEQTVMNTCNTEDVPEGLFFAALDIAAGEYLLAADRTDDSRGVKKVTEGDVSVEFEDESSLIDRLLSSGREEMMAFRRLKW